MRKNIHKKNPKHARYKNTPHKTARNKKITKSKTKPKIHRAMTQMNFI